MKERIGFTTTIPVEIIFAGGYTPCDLNNVFITAADPGRYIARAEADGFPKSMCNWIKGIYGVVMEEEIGTVVTVMEGDCSNTLALAEILQHRGVRTIPFLFPYDRDRRSLAEEMGRFMTALKVEPGAIESVEEGIGETRDLLFRIDDLTWMENRVTGYENHLWLVRSSDMLGDYGEYGLMARDFIARADKRPPRGGVRLAYVGVPPIILDLHAFVEELGARVVYNETQRQFAIPDFGAPLVERYARYTYPYGIFARLEDINREIERRRVDGVIHYVQAFCFRAIEDVIFREELKAPVITIEGDLPKPLDARTKLRIEAFVEMLDSRAHGRD